MPSRSLRSHTLAVVDGVARLRFDQAERGNPIDARFCRDLRDATAALAGLAAEGALRVVVVDAAGRFFSVGGDLKAFGRDRDGLPGYMRSAAADVNEAMSALAILPVPVVVSVGTGQLAVGGAIALVALADVAIAAKTAEFYGAFAAIGLSPDMGSTYFVTRRVGSRHAANLYLMNQRWSAAEAGERGLLSLVVDDADLDATVDGVIERFASGPTAAFAATKSLLAGASSGSLAEQLEAEARSLTALAASDDAWEGIAAVTERRPAAFRGR